MPSPSVFNANTNQWVSAAAITNPTGGVTIDAEARTATNGILAALRNKGAISGASRPNIGHVTEGAGRAVLGAAITDPAGGATVDANGRTTINSILAVLRRFGVIAGSSSLPTLILDEDTNAWASAGIANVTAGGTTDAECRSAVNSALAAMRTRGLIAQD